MVKKSLNKKRIAIVGLPYYAGKLTDQLNALDSNFKFVHFDTYYSKIDKLRFLLYLPFMQAVFSLNGTISKSFVFKLTLLFRKKLLINWSGTDVLYALKAYKEGIVNEQFLSKAQHSCQAEWIEEELSTIGIKPNLVQFQGFEMHQKKKTNDFKVITRIGKNREVFYGMHEVLALVDSFPQIHFTVVGISGFEKVDKPNLSFLGWTQNMEEEYQRHAVAFRFPEHDGQSTFILEALGYGLHCLYKYKMKGVVQVDSIATAKSELKKLYQLYLEGNLEPNQVGMNYIKNDFNQSSNMKSLLSYLIGDL